MSLQIGRTRQTTQRTQKYPQPKANRAERTRNMLFLQEKKENKGLWCVVPRESGGSGVQTRVLPPTPYPELTKWRGVGMSKRRAECGAWAATNALRAVCALGMLLGEWGCLWGPQTDSDGGTINADGGGNFDAGLLDGGLSDAGTGIREPCPTCWSSITTPTIITLSKGPSAIATGDVDHDGFTDIYFAFADANAVGVLRQRNGAQHTAKDFTESIVAVGQRPLSIAVFDLDQDGFDDVVSADSLQDQISIMRSLGTIAEIDQNAAQASTPFLQAATQIPVGSLPVFVTVLPTASVFSENPEENRAYLLGAVAAGDDEITLWRPHLQDTASGNTIDLAQPWQKIKTLTTPSNPRALVALFDAQSARDAQDAQDADTQKTATSSLSVISQNQALVRIYDATAQTLLDAADNPNNNPEENQTSVDVTVGTISKAIASGNFSGTPQRQWISSSSADGTLSYATENPTNDIGWDISTIAAGALPNAMAVGDLDLDGRDDLAVILQGESAVLLLLENMQRRVRLPTGEFPTGVALADFNQDGLLDVAASNQLSSDVYIWLAAP